MSLARGLLMLALPGAAWAEAETMDPEVVRRFIEEEWARTAPPGAVIEVRTLPSLRYRGVDPSLDVVFPEDARPGPFVVPVSCRIDGRVVSRGLAATLVRVERQVWKARVRLERGARVSPDDIVAETRVFEREPVRTLDWDPTRRWTALREVHPGERLTTSHVRALPVIESGDEILLVVRAGGAVITVPARARRSGDVGDTIVASNSLTGALVSALVKEPGIAELVTPNTGPSREIAP